MAQRLPSHEALRGLPIGEAEFARLDLPGRLAALRATIPGRIVFTTSFGLEDQAIGHAVFTQGLSIDVVTLDTGRLFPQTHEVWAETERRYGVKIQALHPDHRRLEQLIVEQGIGGFRESIAARQACCGVRKVEPLRRALDGAAAWVTGLRADQSNARGDTRYLAIDPTHNLIKASPLADWSRERVAAYVETTGIPYNALHDQGFLSIGCAPCTRAVRLGEPERAGRWWWEQEDKKECGLHDNPRRALTRAKTTVEA